MDRTFRIPFVIILLLVVMTTLSGSYPVSFDVFVLVEGLLLLLVGKKVNWHYGRMLIWGLPLGVAFSMLFVGLFFLSNYIPWLNTVLSWSLG
jgi:hypothetical protein